MLASVLSIQFCYFVADVMQGRNICRALWDFYKISNVIEVAEDDEEEEDEEEEEERPCENLETVVVERDETEFERSEKILKQNRISHFVLQD